MEWALRLLVVDDDSELLAALREFLIEEGFDVQTASDGFAAVEIARHRPLDLVLTDLHMPGLAGVDVLRRLQELETPLKVIAMTADTTFLEALAKSWGATVLLRKPFELDDLIASIRDACPRAGVRGTALRHREGDSR